MPEQSVKCPRCGQMVAVPTTGEKVRCPGCGQKFRFDVPPAIPDAFPAPKASGQEPSQVGTLPLPSDPDAPLPVLPELLLGKDVRCPDCGRSLHVTAAAEKVLCPCGRKFWLDGREDRPAEEEKPTEEPLDIEVVGDKAPVAGNGHPAPPPMPAQAAAPETKEVTCPDCGKAVQVPVTGEKVYCTCGRKFRFEAPAEKPVEGKKPPGEPVEVEVLGEEAPTPPPVAANEVKCPRCGGTVMVPVSGEKVRCPGCGQKFRFEVPRAAEGAAAPERPAEAGVPGIASPSAVLAAAPPLPTATPAAAEELRGAWAWLRQTIHRAYEGGGASDDDRVTFRQKADRAAVLANVFLGAPKPHSSGGHVFVTSVLPEMALDEMLSLSLEEYRQLDETLDEVQHLLDARVPQALPPPPAVSLPRPVVPMPPPEAAQPPPARRRRGLTTFEAAAAVLSVAALAAVVIFFPEIKDLAARLQSRGTPKVSTQDRTGPGTHEMVVPAPEPRKVTTRIRVRPPRNRTSTPLKVTTEVPIIQIPEFLPPTPKPETSVAVPPEKVQLEPPEKELPLPKDKVEPPPEPESPWAKLGPGAHRLFNGTDLKDWAQSGAWAVRGGEVHARAAAGPVASAIAGNPEWRDYTLQARARIVRADRQTREGEYYLLILRYQDPQNFLCVRFPIEGIYEVGYYRNGAFHEAGRARHGLGSRFNQWHAVEVTVRGDQVVVVIDNVRTGAPPWSVRGLDRGACGLGVTGGEATFDDVRVRVER